MADSSQLEVKAVMNLNALVMRQKRQQVIVGITEAALDRKKIQELPGIVCYVVQPEDTLWDVAKRFYTSLDQIRELNQLEADELTPGEPILVVKNVAGC